MHANLAARDAQGLAQTQPQCWPRTHFQSRAWRKTEAYALLYYLSDTQLLLLCCKSSFNTPCCPKKQKRYHSMYLHVFILLRLSVVIKDSDQGTDCTSSQACGHQ